MLGCIRDCEDDLDLEVLNEGETNRDNPNMVRQLQPANRPIRTHADVPRQTVPLKVRTDSYREIRKRHTDRKQTDRSFH